jgi:3-dehydroquinate synthetase
MPVDELLAIMRHDKKKPERDDCDLYCRNRIGCVELVENVPESLVRENFVRAYE